jgi:signal transduction histidine kinase
MGRDYQGFFDTLVSLMKIIYLDMGLAMDAYIYAGRLKLEERNKLLEQLDSKKQLLTDTIVHDLRNPVAGLQGFISVLKNQAQSLSESQRQAMAEAERACVMLNSMIDNVLAISRMEEGKLDTVLENVNLNELADEIGRVYTPFAGSRGKTIHVKHGKSVETRTDRGLLQRILANLVMNSIRHATGAKRVDIETGRTSAGRASISVVDDGPGIPREFHDIIFEKFGGVHLRKTGLKLDTGLGLVFCRMAARQLGGELELVSDAGKGTRFTVVL